MRPTDDEIILNRYVDGELDSEEEQALEDRLAAEDGLRSKLAELVALGASIDIALSGVAPEEVTAAPARPAWYKRQPALAAGLAILVIGAAFVGIREWRRGAAPPGLDELADPKTPYARRVAIYDSWPALLGPEEFERIAWAQGPREPDPKARTILYSHLPQGRVTDVTELARQVRANWSSRDLEPLGVLMTLASRQPTMEVEDVYADILWNGPDLDPEWLGIQLQWIQRAFRTNDRITAYVTRALDDPLEKTQAFAALARASVGAPEGLERAVRLLRSTSGDVRDLAATAIERHGTNVEKAILAKLIDDPDERVQQKAKQAAALQQSPESRQQ